MHIKSSRRVRYCEAAHAVQLIVERGADAVEALPKSIRKNKEAVAETCGSSKLSSSLRFAVLQTVGC